MESYHLRDSDNVDSLFDVRDPILQIEIDVNIVHFSSFFIVS